MPRAISLGQPVWFIGLQKDHVCARLVGARIVTRMGNALASVEVRIVNEVCHLLDDEIAMDLVGR